MRKVDYYDFFSCFDIKQKALLKKSALIFKEIEKD